MVHNSLLNALKWDLIINNNVYHCSCIYYYGWMVILPVAVLQSTQDTPVITLLSDTCYVSLTVTTGDLQWVPLGNQSSQLTDIRPVHDDIVIAKLRPGQVGRV